MTGFNEAFGLITKEPNKRVLTFSLVDYLANKAVDFKKYDIILFKNLNNVQTILMQCLKS